MTPEQPPLPPLSVGDIIDFPEAHKSTVTRTGSTSFAFSHGQRGRFIVTAISADGTVSLDRVVRWNNRAIRCWRKFCDLLVRFVPFGRFTSLVIYWASPGRVVKKLR